MVVGLLEHVTPSNLFRRILRSEALVYKQTKNNGCFEESALPLSSPYVQISVILFSVCALGKLYMCSNPLSVRRLPGSLPGNNYGDSDKNVIQKVNPQCFKLRQMLANLSWIRSCIEVQEKTKKVVVLCSREIRYLHVVVVHLRQRNVKKSVMHVQSCCTANLNLLVFCGCRWRRSSRCLSSLVTVKCMSSE